MGVEDAHHADMDQTLGDMNKQPHAEQREVVS